MGKLITPVIVCGVRVNGDLVEWRACRFGKAESERGGEEQPKGPFEWDVVGVR